MTMRVLIVEDDAVLRDGLTVGLSIGGFTADAVKTCEEAGAALTNHEFDALVLDLMLPDGSGLDVLKSLRERQDATPVLLLTARDQVADWIHGLDAGPTTISASRSTSTRSRRGCARSSAVPLASRRRLSNGAACGSILQTRMSNTKANPSACRGANTRFCMPS